jgi:prophage antirepressor-like protein
MIIFNEKGLYRLIMRSNREEAEAFQDWVFETIKPLRVASGLEGFQVFRMLDKKHQAACTDILRDGLWHAGKNDYIKTNAVANKAVSALYGHPKMLKKESMTPAMPAARQPILADTVRLMIVKDAFGLGLSVSGEVYKKYGTA